jgi:putative FmdB family regulatory protein
LPFYDRSCTSCDWFERDRVERAFTDPVPCPECGSETRRHPATGVSFNGVELAKARNMDPKEAQFHLENKKWLESPEMKAKRDSGQITVAEKGPKEFRPDYGNPKVY